MDQVHASSVTKWIAELKFGSEDAARKLWQRYFYSLVRLARGRLATTSKRVADEEDVAVSVFKSLCKGAKRGRFALLTNRDDLSRLLLTITRQKSVDHKRRETSQKRGGGQVRGESIFLQPGEARFAAGLDELVGKEPTPEYLAQVNEQFDALLGRLRNDALRDIALWRMEGYTNDEIAQQLRITTRSVERKLKLIREKWAMELPT